MLSSASRAYPASFRYCQVFVDISAYVACLWWSKPLVCLYYNLALFFGLGFQPIHKVAPSQVIHRLIVVVFIFTVFSLFLFPELRHVFHWQSRRVVFVILTHEEWWISLDWDSWWTLLLVQPYLRRLFHKKQRQRLRCHNWVICWRAAMESMHIVWEFHCKILHVLQVRWVQTSEAFTKLWWVDVWLVLVRSVNKIWRLIFVCNSATKK